MYLKNLLEYHSYSNIDNITTEINNKKYKKHLIEKKPTFIVQ